MANIAILSTIIVVCAFVVTAAGLAKLESIEEKAMETAKETAKEIATETTQEVLKNEKFLQEVPARMFLQEVAEAVKSGYSKDGEFLPDLLKETDEEETGEK